MQISSVSSPMVTARSNPRANRLNCSMSSGIEFGRIPNNPSKKGKIKDKLQKLKAKITPGPETRSDLKKIVLGSGVAIAGLTLAPLIPVPVVGQVIGTIALWGGVWYGATGVVNMLRRKSGD